MRTVDTSEVLELAEIMERFNLVEASVGAIHLRREAKAPEPQEQSKAEEDKEPPMSLAKHIQSDPRFTAFANGTLKRG